MAEMAAYWMERAQKAERDTVELVTRLALSNGGELRMKQSAMWHRPDDLVLERFEDLSANETVYRGKVNQAA